LGASRADTSSVRFDPKGSIAVGRALRKQPLKVRVLFCWALGFFWIGVGLWGGSATLWWAVALGVGFLVVPFVARPLAADD
jgi:hypothetical protein